MWHIATGNQDIVVIWRRNKFLSSEDLKETTRFVSLYSF